MAEYDIVGSDASYITRDGDALIAKLLAAKTVLQLTRVQTGTGDMPEDLTPYDMAGANGYACDAMIEGVTNPYDGQCMIGVQLTSIGLQEGISVTNFAVMAQDPDKGEICYAYISLHQKPQWIRPERESVNTLARFLLYVLVSSIPIVEAMINPDVLITYDQMEAYTIKVIWPKAFNDAQHYVDFIHNLDVEAHPWLRRYLDSLRDELEELKKIFGGQGSANFFYDFTSRVSGNEPSAPLALSGTPFPILLKQGIWNEAESRIEF